MSLAEPRSADLAQMPATPPESPLAMPVQDFRARPELAFPRLRNGWRVWMARLVAFGGTAAIAIIGFQQMLRTFGDSPTPMQWALLVLFVPTFAWVGFSFCNVLAGLFAPRLTTPQGPNDARVAVVMPIYHEDAQKSIGLLTALSGDRSVFSFDDDYAEDENRPTLSLAFKDAHGALIRDFNAQQTRLLPFFSNLLPEGVLRDYLAKRAGVKVMRE